MDTSNIIKELTETFRPLLVRFLAYRKFFNVKDLAIRKYLTEYETIVWNDYIKNPTQFDFWLNEAQARADLEDFFRTFFRTKPNADEMLSIYYGDNSSNFQNKLKNLRIELEDCCYNSLENFVNN